MLGGFGLLYASEVWDLLGHITGGVELTWIRGNYRCVVAGKLKARIVALSDERNPSLSLTGFREFSAFTNRTEQIQADPTKVFPSSLSAPLFVIKMFVLAELLDKRSFIFLLSEVIRKLVSVKL